VNHPLPNGCAVIGDRHPGAHARDCTPVTAGKEVLSLAMFKVEQMA